MAPVPRWATRICLKCLMSHNAVCKLIGRTSTTIWYKIGLGPERRLVYSHGLSWWTQLAVPLRQYERSASCHTLLLRVGALLLPKADHNVNEASIVLYPLHRSALRKLLLVLLGDLRSLPSHLSSTSKGSVHLAHGASAGDCRLSESL